MKKNDHASRERSCSTAARAARPRRMTQGLHHGRRRIPHQDVAKTRDLHANLIAIEGRPAQWMNTEAHEGAGAPDYMVFMDFDAAGRVVAIRDFWFSRYVGKHSRTNYFG